MVSRRIEWSEAALVFSRISRGTVSETLHISGDTPRGSLVCRLQSTARSDVKELNIQRTLKGHLLPLEYAYKGQCKGQTGDKGVNRGIMSFIALLRQGSGQNQKCPYVFRPSLYEGVVLVLQKSNLYAIPHYDHVRA